MRNSQDYDLYREKSRPVNSGHPLKPLALHGNHEVLEGPAIEGAVILEFPTMEATRTYYHSAAYQEAVKHRFLAPTTGCSSLRESKAEHLPDFVPPARS
jgi:uncharacterized protein (DUF1330 family)